MVRWIHEFRSSGERALTEEERTRLDRRAHRLLALQMTLAVLTAAVFLIGLSGGIIVATGGNPLGYLVFVGSLVDGFYGGSKVTDVSKFALLHRRALRIGTVEEFRRVRGDETARRMWQRTSTQVNAPEDDEEFAHLDLYWNVDEQFEEALKRTAGRDVQYFETVGRDGTVLWVEGHSVRTVIEPSVWEVTGS